MQKWLQAARLFVIGASTLPILLGTLLAFSEQGRFNPVKFICTLAGVVLIHSAANLLNDYYDYQSGVDLNNPEGVFPYSGGSRVIVDGQIRPESAWRAALLCLLAASVIGGYLAFVSGVWVIPLGLYGILTGVFYVHPRFHLLNLGAGELIVGLNFGVLTVAGAYYVQTGFISFSSVAVSFPVALMITLVLIINEFPDYRGDALAAKKTIVVRLGRRRASYLLGALMLGTILSLILGALFGFINVWSLSGLLTLPFIIKATVCVLRHYDNIPALIPANVAIIKAHLFISLYLSAACLLTGGCNWPGMLFLMLVFIYQLFTMRKLCFPQ